MTPRNVLFAIVCLFGALTLLLVYNTYYKSETINADAHSVLALPS